MKRCDKCGYEMADDVIYCSHCGARLDGKLTCINCGREVSKDDSYCPYCGKNPRVKTYSNPTNNSGYTNYSSKSDEVLHGAAIGVVLTLLLSIAGFLIAYLLGDDDCKRGAKIMLIIDIAIGALAVIVYLIMFFTVLNTPYY